MKTIKVLSPFDEHLIKEIPLNDKNQVDEAFALAYKTFNDRKNWMQPFERIAILEKLSELMKEQRGELAKISAEEGGKPLLDSEIEVDRAIRGVKIAIEKISDLTGKEIPMNLTPTSTDRIAYTFREPVGVVLAISAFNHPLNLIVHQVIPAIAVGCPVIVKPALTTPLSCLNFASLLYEAGLDKKWCQVVICKDSVTEHFVSDPRLSFLSFIGSAKVGWKLRSKLPAGASCVLEHGGAAPVIIEADADLEDALPLLIKGGFYHAGQVCVSVQRIFAHHSICAQVANALSTLSDNLIVGDPMETRTEVGPLIDSKEIKRIDGWIKDALKGHAEILSGGKKLPNNCYAPTVVLNPPLDCELSTQEIFGPVVCIYSYNDLNQAIKDANAVPFAFQASIFTKNIDAALRAVKLLEATTVLVNDHTAFRVDWMPFGGRKESGLGMGGIPNSMEDMSFEKLMVIRSGQSQLSFHDSKS